MSKTAAYIEEIKRRAEKLWGDKWQPEITRRYIDLAQKKGDVEATLEKRRSHIYRVFRENTCSTEVLFMLAETVGCSFEMKCTNVEVFRP